MTTMGFIVLIFIVSAFGAAMGISALVRQRQIHLWLHSYYFPGERKPTVDPQNEDVHVFIAICDHFEPEWNHADHQTAVSRVDRWCREYPALFSRYADGRGQIPQHTFFFPQDQYHGAYLDRLAHLCRQGYGDVDMHLHHDRDTAFGLFEKLSQFRDTLYHRHGLLRLDPMSGQIVYGFIHGNWALCNARPDGRWCGVDHEIPILLETGCYADLTMPSAPSETQTPTINSIYYAKDRPGRTRSHDDGICAAVGKPLTADSLLMIQGPLLPDWGQRKYGVLPRIENSDLHAGRPATWERMKLWMKAHVHVKGQPNWYFVKLHTHGCKAGNIDTLLSSQMQVFHEELARQNRQNPHFHYHYVTAWEMTQLVHQAEEGLLKPDWTALAGASTPVPSMV